MFVIYTEILTATTTERWYYGACHDEGSANEIALELGCDRAEGIYHCVCDLADADALHIQNIPDRLTR